MCVCYLDDVSACAIAASNAAAVAVPLTILCVLLIVAAILLFVYR